jgi:hypothetical protein
VSRSTKVIYMLSPHHKLDRVEPRPLALKAAEGCWKGLKNF